MEYTPFLFFQIYFAQSESACLSLVYFGSGAKREMI